jgi:hypothetical protein
VLSMRQIVGRIRWLRHVRAEAALLLSVHALM